MSAYANPPQDSNPATCHHTECNNLVTQKTNGRTRLFCSDNCRRAAHNARQATAIAKRLHKASNDELADLLVANLYGREDRLRSTLLKLAVIARLREQASQWS